MSLLAARNRHFSASALRATLHNLDLRHHNTKETIPPLKRNRNSRHFSNLCSLSIQFRGKRKKKTKEKKNSMKKNVLLVQGISETEIVRNRGRPRKIRNPSGGEIYVNENEDTVVSNFSSTGETSAYAADCEIVRHLSVDKTCKKWGMESRDGAFGISMESKTRKRKRGRPLKNRDSFNQSAVNLEKRDGTMVNLSALCHYTDDSNGKELRRIKEEVLRFLEQLNGEWVNTGKKKVVKACDSSIKRKGSNLWLACGRYIRILADQMGRSLQPARESPHFCILFLSLEARTSSIPCNLIARL